MSIERLRREGWLDNKREEIQLPELSETKINQIRKGEDVIVNRGNETFLIYIRKGFNLNNIEKLTEADLMIRRFPVTARPPKTQI